MINQFKYCNVFILFAKLFKIYFAAILLVFIISPAFAAQSSNTLNDKVIKVGVNNQPPFSMQDKQGNWEGISIKLWKHIAKQKGYKYKFKKLPFIKLIEEIQNGDIDAIISPLTITPKRDRVMDFTQPYYVTGLGIAVVNRKSWFGTIRPFFSFSFLQAVGSLAAVLFVSGMLVWLFERWYNKEEFSKEAGEGFISSIWWIAITMTAGGYGDKKPVSLVGRLIGIVWMFTSVVIISSFIAAVTASLAVSQIQGPVHGKRDLSRVRIATVAGTTSVQYLKENHLVYSTYDSLDKALKVLQHGYVDAVVYDAPLLKYKIRQNFHSYLHVLAQTFDNQYYGIALTKHSKIHDDINQIILEYIDSYQWKGELKEYLGSS